MSFTDRLVLWLHIGFAIFTIGPVALAISSSPRYIRRREVAVLRYLSRITMIFAAASLLVLVFGIVLGELDRAFAKPWLTISMTLFVVAIVLLALIIRDQRRAIRALSSPAEAAQAEAAQGGAAQAAGETTDQSTAAGTASPAGADSATAEAAGGHDAVGGVAPAGGPAGATLAEHVASVERGRIALMGGVVNLLWLVILGLMVWRP